VAIEKNKTPVSCLVEQSRKKHNSRAKTAHAHSRKGEGGGEKGAGTWGEFAS
jgi:hypothetical protein